MGIFHSGMGRCRRRRSVEEMLAMIPPPRLRAQMPGTNVRVWKHDNQGMGCRGPTSLDGSVIPAPPRCMKHGRARRLDDFDLDFAVFAVILELIRRVPQQILGA